jgi:hypothetical protein
MKTDKQIKKEIGEVAFKIKEAQIEVNRLESLKVDLEDTLFIRKFNREHGHPDAI